MRQIDKLTNYPSQKLTIVGENREQIGLSMVYMPRQQRWKFDISYGDFTANGVCLTVGPNILRQWKNILPFGIACGSKDGLDPFYIEDFRSGRITLLLLNAQDVADLEDLVYT